jgi:carbon storage regulator
MLILTRQEGEKICIGDEVVVVVTHNGNDHVRLGIDAPADKIVLRAELRQEKADKAAAVVPADSVAPAA